MCSSDLLGNFIPGNPTVVVQNMPGAGSLRAANHVQQVAARDGTVIAALDRAAPLFAVLGGNPVIRFSASEMNWLGTLSSYASDAFILWVRKDAAAKSIEDVLRPGGPEIKVGGAAAGSTDDSTVVLLRDVLGMRLHLISGYSDGNTISLALERGEVEGRTAGVSALATTRPDWLKPDSLVRPMLQMGRATRLPAYADVPLAREFARDARARSIIEAAELPYQLARPYLMTPGVPPERAAALRKAFMDATNAPALKEEAARTGMELSPVDGVEVGRLVAQMGKAPPEALDYLRKLLVAP